MGRLLILEPFDEIGPDLADLPPSADWIAGHAAGLEESLAATMVRQAAVREDVAQALVDISFTYAEARQQVLTALTPLFTIIMERLLPELARQAIGPQVVHHLLAAAQDDSLAPMRIVVHDHALAGLAECLPREMPLPVALEADPTLGPGQVLLRHRSQETTLDLVGVVREMNAILAAIFDETERKIHHG